MKENEILKGIPHLSLTDKVKVSDGNHMSISEKFLLNGIPYYRGQDVKSFFIEDSTPICIDEQTFNNTYMKRSHLEYGDILLSIVGTIGSVSLVSTQNKSTCSCKLAILRPNLCDSDNNCSIFIEQIRTTPNKKTDARCGSNGFDFRGYRPNCISCFRR